MMKKTFLALIIGLVAAASLVGCGAEQPATPPPATSAAASQAAAPAAPALVGTAFTSADGSFSCTIPEGFTQASSENLPAGSAAFTHTDGRALVIAASSAGVTDLSTLTQENMTKTMQAQYPDAVLNDFTMEGVDDGTIVSYHLVTSVSGMQMTLAQVTYVNASHTINFTLTGADASAADLSLLKQVASSLKINA